jgi:hypothetical protein
MRNRLNNVARLSQRSHPIEPDVPPEVAYIAGQQNVPGAAPPRRAGGALAARPGADSGKRPMPRRSRHPEIGLVAPSRCWRLPPS